MNPDNMRFDCMPKDFLRLYALVAQLPEGIVGIKNLETEALTARLTEFVVVRIDGSMEYCAIYPTAKDDGIDLEIGRLPPTAQLFRRANALELEHNNAIYIFYGKNPNFAH